MMKMNGRDDIRQPGSKIGDHSWEVNYEEEDRLL